ncbi:MAG: hypothetical protein WAT36_12535 [Chromatiaceae bacterium]
MICEGLPVQKRGYNRRTLAALRPEVRETLPVPWETEGYPPTPSSSIPRGPVAMPWAVLALIAL